MHNQQHLNRPEQPPRPQPQPQQNANQDNTFLKAFGGTMTGCLGAILVVVLFMLVAVVECADAMFGYTDIDDEEETTSTEE